MTNELIFSWAENAKGKLVHVDSVPNGLQCNCTCPCCHERLIARHGKIKEHGFAHHSDSRMANLKICYEVVLYKLAEQIVQSEKYVHAPSYYGIFKECDISFTEVVTDSHYERLDKQPDVIATTKEGKKYLIEFVFSHKVQHRQPIDYHKLTCLEIDLSQQSLDTVRDFVLKSNAYRRWINNEDYFNKIEDRYNKAGKPVRIVDERECQICKLRYSCCAVMYNANSYTPVPIVIENSGVQYRLCKTELYCLTKKKYEKGIEEQRRRIKEEHEAKEKAKKIKEEAERKRIEELRTKYNCERTCFECSSNLAWANRDGYANCGCYMRMGVPKKTPPTCAISCKGFRKK